MECAETGPHTPHSSFIEVRICILILCAECSYRQRAEEYAVLGVHEVAVDAHLLAIEAHCHVGKVVIIIVVVPVERLPAAQHAVIRVSPLPCSDFNIAVYVETNEGAARREDHAVAVVVLVVNEVVLVEAHALALRSERCLLHNAAFLEPLLAVADHHVANEQPVL